MLAFSILGVDAPLLSNQQRLIYIAFVLTLVSLTMIETDGREGERERQVKKEREREREIKERKEREREGQRKKERERERNRERVREFGTTNSI